MNAKPTSGLYTLMLVAAELCGGAPVCGDDAAAGDAGKAWRDKAVRFIREIEDKDLRSEVSWESVYVLVRAGDLERAHEAADRVTASQKRIYAYTQVAKGYRDARKAETALAALEQCWESLDVEQRRDRIDYMARAYAEAGFVEEALELAAEMKPDWQRGHVLRDIATIVAQAGDVDRARALVDAQGTHEHEQAGLALMVASLASSQKTDDALAAAEGLVTAKNSDHAFENLAKELVRVKRYAEAEKAAARIAAPAVREKIEGKIAAAKMAGGDAAAIEARIAAAATREEKLPIYRSLIKRLAADGKTAEAEAAIEAMIAVIKASPRPPENLTFGKSDDQGFVAAARAMHLEIAKALAKSGDETAAREQVAKASEAILQLPAEAGLGKTMLLMALVGGHIEMGDLDAARKLVEQLPDNHDKTMAVMQLAHALVKSGGIAGAVAVAKQITYKKGRGHTVGRIAGEVIRAGELDAAKSLLAGLGETAEDVQGYRYAAEAMIETGRANELDEWLAAMPSAAARAYACLGAAEPR